MAASARVVLPPVGHGEKHGNDGYSNNTQGQKGRRKHTTSLSHNAKQSGADNVAHSLHLDIMKGGETHGISLTAHLSHRQQSIHPHPRCGQTVILVPPSNRMKLDSRLFSTVSPSRRDVPSDGKSFPAQSPAKARLWSSNGISRKKMTRPILRVSTGFVNIWKPSRSASVSKIVPNVFLHLDLDESQPKNGHSARSGGLQTPPFGPDATESTTMGLLVSPSLHCMDRIDMRLSASPRDDAVRRRSV
ncbi:hypothetical protein SODALDRAFT_361695 [Sodiomyces alkalinus F11]|uniref:Uncharacterized protein n=1 Tax=Sodiomyces alkalinus (strain CBS 110278 / VKM F-3762 / F11) TaxID=1314773 RepID=A0A3N2PQT2_SODAK|nr:hypothetical protein SODALDRAFT_361695 [Sodiomyces alkalinus F11]ROT36869.1 hypothetical protein SODALDRAFT_361695 [Sodiomyces alkalinus F11]